MSDFRALFVALAMIAVAGMALSLPALGHEYTRADGAAIDARWIEDKYPECCGRIDCEPVDQDRVIFTPQGWEVRGFAGTVRIPDVLPSDPGKGPWVCRYLFEMEEPPIRCLFLPGARL